MAYRSPGMPMPVSMRSRCRSSRRSRIRARSWSLPSRWRRRRRRCRCRRWPWCRGRRWRWVAAYQRVRIDIRRPRRDRWIIWHRIIRKTWRPWLRIAGHSIFTRRFKPVVSAKLDKNAASVIPTRNHRRILRRAVNSIAPNKSVIDLIFCVPACRPQRKKTSTGGFLFTKGYHCSNSACCCGEGVVRYQVTTTAKPQDSINLVQVNRIIVELAHDPASVPIINSRPISLVSVGGD